MAFIVRVLRGAQPAQRVNVRVGFTSTFSGMSHSQYTDAFGRAVFDQPQQGVVEVQVEGISYGLHDYRDGATITLNLDMGDDDDADYD